MGAQRVVVNFAIAEALSRTKESIRKLRDLEKMLHDCVDVKEDHDGVGVIISQKDGKPNEGEATQILWQSSECLVSVAKIMDKYLL